MSNLSNKINDIIRERLIIYSDNNDFDTIKVLENYSHRKNMLRLAFTDEYRNRESRLFYKAYKGTIQYFENIKDNVDKIKRHYGFKE